MKLFFGEEKSGTAIWVCEKCQTLSASSNDCVTCQAYAIASREANRPRPYNVIG